MSSFFTSIKANRAYRLHSTANQLIKIGEHDKAAKRLDKALQLYDEAYSEGNRRRLILMAYSIILMRYGRFEKAKEVLLVINRQDKLSNQEKYQLRVNYAIVQWKLGNSELALSTIRKADAEGKSSVIYSTMGMLLTDRAAETGDFEEALAYAKEALEYDENDPSSLDNMGQLKYYMAAHERKNGNSEAADALMQESMDWLKKAYEEKADQVTTLYFLAKIHHERGESEKAKEYIEKTSECYFTAMCQITREDIAKLKKEIEG